MPNRAEDLYLDLLKRVLTRELFIEDEFVDVGVEVTKRLGTYADIRRRAYAPVERALQRRGLRLIKMAERSARESGKDWPRTADTMVGLKRLDNLQYCIQTVIDEGVAGDLIETGVWRGGASIFMRAALAAYGDGSRTVWVADSFEGLPPPDPRYPADAHLDLSGISHLAVPQQEVERRFARYGLLDDQVRFLKGWFKDTLPGAPIDKLAVIRLDGDLYQSTIEALDALYPRLMPGGFLIVDDYGVIPACRHAVEEYRASQGISEPIEDIDGTGVYWRRAA